jgi:hypothetical protein
LIEFFPYRTVLQHSRQLFGELFNSSVANDAQVPLKGVRGFPQNESAGGFGTTLCAPSVVRTIR